MLHPIEVENELIVLLKAPWDFASVSLYRSSLVSTATLSICCSQSSKDCGSLALKISMLFMKCWFSSKLDDLIIFCKASIVFVRGDDGYYSSVLSDVKITPPTDWLKSNGTGFSHYWFTYVWEYVGVSCGTCMQYASPSGCCVSPKLSVCQDAVKVASFSKFDAWFNLKVLGFLGKLTPVGVLSWGLARVCEIAFYINLLVFSGVILHAQVILCRSPDTLLVNFVVLVW